MYFFLDWAMTVALVFVICLSQTNPILCFMLVANEP